MLKNRDLHIYEVARVFRKNAPTWISTLKDLEEDRDVMRSVYAPLRAAINFEMRRPGSGKAVLTRMLRKLTAMRNYEPIERSSLAAFDIWCNTLMPEFDSIEEDFVNAPARNQQFLFAGCLLKGCFHAKMRTKSGETLWLYLHPSQWDADQRVAFTELLTVLVEQVYSGSRNQVRLVALRNQEIVEPARSFKALRKELEATVTLLAKLKKAA